MKQQLATAVSQVQRSAQDLTILTQKYEGENALLMQKVPNMISFLFVPVQKIFNEP